MTDTMVVTKDGRWLVPAMRCETCGDTIHPIEGVNAVRGKSGGWYHARCVEAHFENGVAILVPEDRQKPFRFDSVGGDVRAVGVLMPLKVWE
jgi:hypothetical protein